MDKPWLTDEYLEYLDSDEWQHKRALKLALVQDCEMAEDIRYAQDGRKVKVCNGPLHVHHKTYDRLGNESLSDLQVLCEFHHNLAERIKRKDRDDDRRKNALRTFARKKYGEGWYDWADSWDLEQLEEEFDEWVESKSYDY